MLVDAAREGSPARCEQPSASAALLSIQAESDLTNALQLGALDALDFDKGALPTGQTFQGACT